MVPMCAATPAASPAPSSSQSRDSFVSGTWSTYRMMGTNDRKRRNRNTPVRWHPLRGEFKGGCSSCWSQSPFGGEGLRAFGLGLEFGKRMCFFQSCASCASWIMSCCTAPALAGGGSEQEQEEEGEDEGWSHARHANGEFVSVPLLFSFFERGAGIGGAAGILRQARACIGTGVTCLCVYRECGGDGCVSARARGCIGGAVAVSARALCL
ncbi:hypothetical protein B0H14DRAFT_582200 [Mycena olivaceomarginata]|nr:hypothetical protein B0H14DRAFT_582200 [Mycena olivaceomarginata]